MVSIGSVVHIHNEELLIPHWIAHHQHLYEKMVFIDHHSTDMSLELIGAMAPEAIVVPSRLSEFDAQLVDDEVMGVEEEYLNTDYKITSNITEFMWHDDLQGLLYENKEFEAIGFKAYMMVDKDLSLPLDGPLWKDRHNGYLDNETALNSRRWRFIHRMEHGHYGLGRHHVNLKDIKNPDWTILFASFSPWPQAIPRKMQIQHRIPERDKRIGSGIQHMQNLQTLDNFYRSELVKSSDLLLDKTFARNYNSYITPRGRKNDLQD